MATGPDDGISTNELMAEAGLNPEGLRASLYDKVRVGIERNDTASTVFVHRGVKRASHQRFE